jgi:GMP synthase (glutamine-hydrolysing)
MKIQEIKAKDLKPKKFIDEKVREIREIAGDGIAISALSGGVDSSVVTALAHRRWGKSSRPTSSITGSCARESRRR